MSHFCPRCHCHSPWNFLPPCSSFSPPALFSGNLQLCSDLERELVGERNSWQVGLEVELIRRVSVSWLLLVQWEYCASLLSHRVRVLCLQYSLGSLSATTDIAIGLTIVGTTSVLWEENTAEVDGVNNMIWLSAEAHVWSWWGGWWDWSEAAHKRYWGHDDLAWPNTRRLWPWPQWASRREVYGHTGPREPHGHIALSGLVLERHPYFVSTVYC